MDYSELESFMSIVIFPMLGVLAVIILFVLMLDFLLGA